MVLRIRLARFGKKHAPFYNIVVAHARTSPTSPPLEVLGTYNPVPQTPSSSHTTSSPSSTHTRPYKDVRLDLSRARYWVGIGAQPSNTAWRLLSMVGILEPQFRVKEKLGKVVRRDGELSVVRAKSAAGSLVGKEREREGQAWMNGRRRIGG